MHSAIILDELGVPFGNLNKAHPNTRDVVDPRALVWNGRRYRSENIVNYDKSLTASDESDAAGVTV